VYSVEQEWQTRSQLANGGNEKEWMAKECRLRTIPLLTIPLPEPAFCEVRDEAPQAPMVNPTV
jgi:hypothetical protein